MTATRKYGQLEEQETKHLDRPERGESGHGCRSPRVRAVKHDDVSVGSIADLRYAQTRRYGVNVSNQPFPDLRVIALFARRQPDIPTAIALKRTYVK